MSTPIVVVDACALFPGSLRDTLLRVAEAGFYRIKITDEILEEMRRNLVKKGMQELKARRLITAIKAQFPEAFVAQHHVLIETMTNDQKDRHVLAAAVASNAGIIVTQNLKDFPQYSLAPFEIEAQSPDEFLVRLFYNGYAAMISIIIEQAKDLHNPPKTVVEVLETLAQHAPTFVSLVRQELQDQTLL